MIEKTGIIGGLYLPEKAEHSRERDSVLVGYFLLVLSLSSNSPDGDSPDGA